MGKVVKGTVMSNCRRGTSAKVTTYLGRFTNCKTIGTKERCGSIRVSRQAFLRRCMGPFHVTLGTGPTVIVATFGTVSHGPVDKGGRLLGKLLQSGRKFRKAMVSS